MKIIDTAKDIVAPEMFGLFFEDINYAADGGLYAEMIENRSFEAREAFGLPGTFYTVADYLYAWEPVSVNGCEPKMLAVEGTPLSEANPHYLRFVAEKAGQGIKNKAYDGITMNKGDEYNISFYARCVKYEGDGIDILVEKDDKTVAKTHITLKKAAKYIPFCDTKKQFTTGWTVVDEMGAERRKLNMNEYAKESEWVKYEGVLMADDSVRGADFIIKFDEAGIIEFDLISLMPKDAVCGVFRKDLYEALDGIHPGFIRFPGGCIVEGISLANRYRWKNTVGELKDRKYIPNLWAFDDSRDKTDLDTQRVDSHYGQSYGIGYYEYFLLCEKLGAKPLPVVGIGAACQFRSDEIVDVDDEKLQEYIQDAVDLIEFANGSVSTKWGSLRARMGHPESFNMEMLAVGNEQWDTESIELFKRVDAFERAIHAKYPEIKLLGTAGPSIDYEIAKDAWDTYRDRQKSNPNYCYAVDEHYYVSPKWMYDRINLYDDYPRDVYVFAGEYAAHPSNKGNNMEGALAEAAFLTGIEKNAGVVKLASYAPLFNRIGHSQWKPDMIWFDDKEVYYTPSYYVQKMYANNVGDYTIDLNGQDIPLREQGIYVSVTGKKKDGTIIIKAANCTDKDFCLPLEDKDGNKICAKAKVAELTGAGDEMENMPQPSKLTEMSVEITGEAVLRANSFNVICLG